MDDRWFGLGDRGRYSPRSRFTKLSTSHIVIVCPGCSAKLKAKSSSVGRSIPCPKCRTPITVAIPAENEPEPIPAVDTSLKQLPLPAAPQQSLLLRMRENWQIPGLVVGIFGLMICASSTSRAIPLLCYPLLVLTGIAIASRCSRKYTWRWIWIAGIALR